MTAPSGEVPPSLQPDSIPDTMVGSHVVVLAIGTPWSVGHTKENAKFDTPSATPVLTDSCLGIEGKNIPHPRLETSIRQENAKNGKKDPKSSWKSALLGSTNSTLEVALAKFTQMEEGTEIKLPDNLMDKNHLFPSPGDCWLFLLLLTIIDMIRRWAKSRWKLKGSVDITTMLGGLFLFKFNAEEDLSYVLLGFWAYGKHVLPLAKWKPRFDPFVELNHMSPIWVKLPSLLWGFWDEQIFHLIGNSFGSYVAALLINPGCFMLAFVSMLQLTMLSQILFP